MENDTSNQDMYKIDLPTPSRFTFQYLLNSVMESLEYIKTLNDENEKKRIMNHISELRIKNTLLHKCLNEKGITDNWVDDKLKRKNNRFYVTKHDYKQNVI